MAETESHIISPTEEPQPPWPAKGRYLHLGVINSGSYGVVHRAQDINTGETVAIKEEFDGMSLLTEREIKILKWLPPHPSIVELKEVIVQSEESVFVVMEYVEIDLHRLMQVRRRPFSLPTVKTLMRQILEGVDHLHYHGVMHRDLKPSNILVTEAAQVKLCDFGLSTETETDTPGMVSLWYRAPEVLKGKTYTYAIDMWSMGCILAELVLSEPLFPGRSEIDELVCIYRTMGSRHLLEQRFAEASLEGAPLLSASGISLLRRLLALNPRRRITAGEALNHAWFDE